MLFFLKFGSFSGNDVHWNIVGLYFGGCLCFDFEISTKVPTDIYRIDTIQRGKILLCFLLPVIPEVHQLTSCQTGSSLKTEKYPVTCFLGTSPWTWYHIGIWHRHSNANGRFFKATRNWARNELLRIVPEINEWKSFSANGKKKLINFREIRFCYHKCINIFFRKSMVYQFQNRIPN